MKVLYLDHPESDYLAAQVYLGLCQVLGPENVVDYPRKDSYHGLVHEYPSQYDVDPGDSRWEKWRRDGTGPMGSTSPFPWMIAQDSRAWGRDEILARAWEFDLAVLASPRRDNAAALSDLLSAGARFRRLVMMDGEDYDAIRWDYVERFRPAVYFKRDLVASPQVVYPEQEQRMRGSVRVEPLPLAITAVSRGLFPVEHDVFLPGGRNTPGGLEPWWPAVQAATPSCRLGDWPYERYLDILGRSRIAVAVRGHSPDSYRSWEALGVQGPMVMVQKHDFIRPHPFIEGEHVVHFENPEELGMLLRRYLADEPARARVAAAGHAHALAHHTVRARAEYLLEKSL